MSLSDEERSIVVGLEVEKVYVAYNETIWLMEKTHGAVQPEGYITRYSI